jgi:hypothetical protein
LPWILVWPNLSPCLACPALQQEIGPAQVAVVLADLVLGTAFLETGVQQPDRRRGRMQRLPGARGGPQAWRRALGILNKVDRSKVEDVRVKLARLAAR